MWLFQSISSVLKNHDTYVGILTDKIKLCIRTLWLYKTLNLFYFMWYFFFNSSQKNVIIILETIYFFLFLSSMKCLTTVQISKSYFKSQNFKKKFLKYRVN